MTTRWRSRPGSRKAQQLTPAALQLWSWSWSELRLCGCATCSVCLTVGRWDVLFYSGAGSGANSKWQPWHRGNHATTHHIALSFPPIVNLKISH